MIKNGNRYLINTDDWFTAPDGESYKSVWGKCYIKNIKEVFNFDPLRPSTNWYCQIGKNGKEMIVAGCRIHYAIRCEKRPKNKFVNETYPDKDTKVIYSANRIYFAE